MPGPMSRCRRTDELLDATFIDAGLTRGQADHLGGCSECARNLALVRRFDSELRGVGAQLVPEPSAWHDAASATWATSPKGERGMWRVGLLAATAVAVIALAVVGTRLWPSGTDVGFLQADGVDAEQLGGWLDRALVVAHAQADPGGTSTDGWEAVRVEVCGDAAIAFFEHSTNSHGHLWAIGRPSDIFDRSIEAGWSRTLSALDVAERRAGLAVCDVALDDTQPEAAGADLPVPPQQVVRVPDFFWIGDPDAAPVEIEIVGGDRDDVVEVGIARDAFLYAQLDDASIRAVDIVTEDLRYRYTVGVPGFTVFANVVDDAVRFELLDASGDIVAAGPVVEWPADPGFGEAEEARRAAAEQAAIAEALAERERRALETGENGARCAEWRTMTEPSQLTITEVLVPDLERARTLQQLPASASRSDIIAAARASLDKGCQGSSGTRALADVARGLFGD
jgi:hypothetical protein